MKSRILILIVYVLAVLPALAQKKITLDDIYKKGAFIEKPFYGVNWMKDGRYYSQVNDNGDIVKMDVTTGKEVETIMKASDLNPSIDIQEYSFSADEKKILFTTDMQPIYRRSYKAVYYVYDIASKKLTPLSAGGSQSYATFSPDGSKVAFVRDNNLFFVDLAGNREQQVTTDGKFNYIINGSTDWVYEEEFGFAQGFFWSPDGKRLAYYTFDESAVKEYNMQLWNEKQLYPNDYRFKYPKAGEANSVVSVSVYDLAAGKANRMDIGNETDIYIPRIKWTLNSTVLSIRRLNRLQNKLEVLHADVTTGKSTVILTEENNTYVDVEYADDLIYLQDGKHLLYTSEMDGFKHLYLYTIDGKKVRQITSGKWEVDDFVGINEATKPMTIYYTSTEISPIERHFYSIDIEGKNKQKLSTEKGTNNVNMSTDFTYYFLLHSSAESPLKVSLFQTKGNKPVKVLEDNAQLKATVKEFNLSKKEFFTFKTSDGVELYGSMIKPADFDPNKKYPVLMYVYGGPASQNVVDSWAGGHYYWHQFLAQQHGYIIVCVDNRGTVARGEAFKKSTYGQLGRYETQDQIEGAKYLASQPYVDGNRIGIWGWSYGGYMSSLCMTLGAEVFKAGIAVAPVTTWRLYDSVYTERFLKRPQDNPEGYDKYSPLTHAGKLKGAFLLVHGTGDDNVHFQNAVLLQDALIRANKQFQSFYYPNRNHGIYGGNTRLHLYQMMTDFVTKGL